MIKTCPVCMKQFNTRHSTSKYCSRACRDEARKEPSKKSVFTCKQCNKKFEDYTYRQTSFCSRSCNAKFNKSGPRPWQKNPDFFVTKPCEVCGKEFTTTRTQIERRHGGKYCSRACMGKAASKRLLETGGPNYQGGITKTNYKYYRGSNWDSQKRKAMKRDNKECQVCHSRGLFSRLGVHHIKPYRFFDGDFESANQLSNLITLCQKHHVMVEAGSIPCPKPKL